MKKNKSIYFRKQVLTHSVENRKIDLLTLSSYKDIMQDDESCFVEELFPNKKHELTVKRFHPDKMIVFLSARVHPGETPSSYSMRGIIKFLLSKKDVRAQTLRDNFVFKIVPMINPDGVFHGYFRMDTLN